MRDTLVIARRELLERIRSKWFVIVTLVSPVLMTAMIVVPALLGGQGTQGARVAIVDRTREDVGATMSYQLRVLLGWDTRVAPPEADEQTLRRQIAAHELNGYVLVPADALDGGEIVYAGDNASNQSVTILFSRAVQSVALQKRAARLGLDAVQLALLMRPVNYSVRHSTGEATEQDKSGIATFLLGYLIAFVIYVMITLYGINVMRSVVTEKTSRVVELLVATTRPRAMMSGKILGVGCAGLVQIAIWVVIGALLLELRGALLGVFGVEPGAAAMLPTLTPGQGLVTLGCFLLGFLFYSALYAAVGAMVSSEQDAQQAQMPITFLLVIAMVALTAVTSDPRGQTAVVMTMVPFWSPMLMPMRFFLGGATPAEVALSLAILLLSTVGVARAAARIYRVGILMYGKRPGLREIVRWLRH